MCFWSFFFQDAGSQLCFRFLFYFFRCKHSKLKKKRKRCDVFKETTTNHNEPWRHVCAITSLEGFDRRQPVFRSVVMRFGLSGQSCYFYDWLNARQFSPLPIRGYLRMTGMETSEAEFPTNTVHFLRVPTKNESSHTGKNHSISFNFIGSVSEQ